MNMQPESLFETAQRREKIKPLQRKWGDWKKPILDVGGGDGSVWDDVDIPTLIDLVEPNIELRQKAVAKGFYSIWYDGISQVDEDCYSAAVCLGVLEHLDDLEVEDMLQYLMRYDRIYITVPNADSLHRHIGTSMGMLKYVDELHEGDLSIGHRRVWHYDRFANLVLDFNSRFNRNYHCEIGTVGFKFLDNNGMKPFLKNYSELCEMAERQDFVGWNRMHGAEIYTYMERI